MPAPASRRKAKPRLKRATPAKVSKAAKAKPRADKPVSADALALEALDKAFEHVQRCANDITGELHKARRTLAQVRKILKKASR